MSKFALHVALIVVVWLSLATVCLGKQVYLADGSILECESFHRAGDTVVVKVNRDILLEFSMNEIDQKKTFERKAGKRNSVSKEPEAQNTLSSALPQAAAPVAVASGNPDVSQSVSLPAPKEIPVAKEIIPPEPAQADTESSPGKADLERKSDEAAAMMVEALQKNDPALMKKAVETQKALLEQGAEAPRQGNLKFLLIMLVFSLLIIVSMWVIFEKAGESGWKSLVPLYNMYIITEIAGKPWWWFLLLLIPFVGMIIYLIVMVALAERFGRGVLYGLGLFFLPMFFMPMLAFGGAQYHGDERFVFESA